MKKNVFTMLLMFISLASIAQTKVQVNYNDLDLPAYADYEGETRCHSPISEVTFMTVFSKVGNISNETDRFNKAVKNVKNWCMSAAQVMKLATLFDTKDYRDRLVKVAWKKAYDVENLTEATVYLDGLFNVNVDANVDMQVSETNTSTNNESESGSLSMNVSFNVNESSSEEFNNNSSIQMNTEHNDSYNSNSSDEFYYSSCYVSDDKHARLVNNINSKPYPDEKLKILKVGAKSMDCLSLKQVKELLQLFVYPSDKLKVAKFLYNKVSSSAKDEYYTIADEFTSTFDRDDLLDHINGDSLDDDF